MRIWETRFQVYDPIPEFPIPNVVVEEIQESSDYGHYGKFRKGDKGSQLVYTLSGEGRFSVNEKEYI
ncbi:MAG TPA: hypothetical protein PLJ44_06860, partial [Victivallales bacterium]|nr:hypothetical protein [Victivallales bacterium]